MISLADFQPLKTSFFPSTTGIFIQKDISVTKSIHPCRTAAILDILGMKSRRCVANLRFAAINHAKQTFQCALCSCAQITDQKVN